MFRNAQTINIPTAFSSEGTTEKQRPYEKPSWPSQQPFKSALSTSINLCPFLKSAVSFWTRVGLNQEKCKSITYNSQYFNVLFGYSWFAQPFSNISIILEVETGIICVVNPQKILLTSCQCTQSRLKTISTVVSEEISRKQAFRSGFLWKEDSVARLALARDLFFWLNQPRGLHEVDWQKQQRWNDLPVTWKSFL